MKWAMTGLSQIISRMDVQVDRKTFTVTEDDIYIKKKLIQLKIDKTPGPDLITGLSIQSVKICYQYHAATAVLDNDHFPTQLLQSGMAYRSLSDNLLHCTVLSAT